MFLYIVSKNLDRGSENGQGRTFIIQSAYTKKSKLTKDFYCN